MPVAAEIDRALAVIRRGADSIVSEEDLIHKLERYYRTGEPLRVKLGVDPSAPDIHLGHTVQMRKLRQFQELGHTVYFVIGDFTGRIGDPSGRSQTRPQLTEEQVRANARTYQEQAFKILDPARTQIVFNNDWLGRLQFADIVRLASHVTVARMLERDDFAKRLGEGHPISMHELLYPIAQAYDSIFLHADVELGGTEQTFTFTLTRELMREYGLEPQVFVTMPILVGTDGVNRMSKSLGNYIGIDDPPGEMLGKVMSLPDHVLVDFYRLVTDVPDEEIDRIQAGMRDGSLNPRDAKLRLGHVLVAMYHGEEQAQAAEREFINVFSEGGLPEDIPESPVDGQAGESRSVVALLAQAGLVDSNSEARRLITQGGVRVDGRRVTAVDETVALRDGLLLQIGRRRFARLRIKA